jgi:alpha-N-arabinofuranosidase
VTGRRRPARDLAGNHQIPRAGEKGHGGGVFVMTAPFSVSGSCPRRSSRRFRAAIIALLCGLLCAFAGALPVRADLFAANVRVLVNKPAHPLSRYLYGAHVEHMFHAIQGGLWGELLSNRKLVAAAEGEGNSALPDPWFRFGDNDATIELDAPKQAALPGDLARSFRLQAPEGRRVGVAQGGIALRPGDRVRLTVWLRGEGRPTLSVSLGDANAAATVALPAPTASWRRAVVMLTLPRSVAAGEARLTFALAGPGVAWLYAPSLMTEAAVAVGGFDPAVLARARTLAPSFLRYPGGNFAQNYDWRDGVGPRDERPRVAACGAGGRSPTTWAPRSSSPCAAG